MFAARGSCSKACCTAVVRSLAHCSVKGIEGWFVAVAERAELPWWSKGRVLRERTLSVERIVEAALALIDRDGLERLSMRRLGTDLGAGATSIYWHLPNKA